MRITTTIVIVILLSCFIMSCSANNQSNSKTSIEIPPVEIFATTVGPPIWSYSLKSELSASLKIKDLLKIEGIGITKADVQGAAAQNKYGAWKVKEITANYVMFECTKSAVIRQDSFEGFLITAPSTKTGEVKYYAYGKGIGRSGTTQGPVK